MANEKDTLDFKYRELIPENDTKILRYMDFPEFLYMLQYEKLYFTKAKLLNDRYEELLPGIAAKAYKEDNMKDYRKSKFIDEIEDRTYISSWTEFYKESYAMWHIYSKKYGIAVETDCLKLGGIIKPFNGIVRRVKYVKISDCENITRTEVKTLGGNDFHTEEFFTLKSDFYEYEKEIRAIFIDKSDEAYRAVKIDIKNFLNSIIISPFAGRWFREMVRDIVYSKYNLKNIEINISGVEIMDNKT